MSAPFGVPLDVNPEAERAVIAALMRNPDGKEIIRLGLAADLFAGDETREAFAAIAAFLADGTPPDAATLRNAISPAALIEVETSLLESASAANLPVYVKLLKDCHRERHVQAARDRLAKAAAAGSPDHELQAILESIRQAGADESSGGFSFCDTAKLRNADLQSPRFLVDPIIPRDQVTLFGGHGGSGKTLLSYVIAAHVATGTDWGGLIVMPGRVLIVSFEDPEELVMWRFRNVAEEYGLNLAAIEKNITMIDATEAQPIMRETSSHGVRDVQPSTDGAHLMNLITRDRCDLVVIDNVSDAFDGDENNRRQVRGFVRYLTRAIRPYHGGMLLLAHIDKVAARYGASGNSYSGSTAWHNSVRSRLALTNNELHQEKLNVGKRIADPIKLVWSPRGLPIPDDSADAQSIRTALENEDNAALLACFRAAQEAGATVPTGERGPSTAWHALSIYPECSKTLRENKERFRQGIARLARAGEIARETYRDSRRHACERYVIPTARVCASFETSAEVAQPKTPRAPMREFSHRGVGINARTETDTEELAQPAYSPVAKTLLAAVTKEGVAPDDLKRTANRAHPKAGLALIEATINELLLSGAIGRINGKLVAAGEVAS
jgi:KaiC/GvpD/RAD55 family RecA-like ATPase